MTKNNDVLKDASFSFIATNRSNKNNDRSRSKTKASSKDFNISTSGSADLTRFSSKEVVDKGKTKIKKAISFISYYYIILLLVNQYFKKVLI